MKPNFKIICLPLVLCFYVQLMGQYVTIKGKQFYDQNGDPFYPVVCNYVVELGYDPINTTMSSPLVTADFVLQPASAYGSAGDYVDGFDDSGNDLMAKGPERIRADFEKMLDMGFNTIRVFGLDMQKLDGVSGPNSGGFFRARLYPENMSWIYDLGYDNYVTDMSLIAQSPYASDNTVSIIIDHMHTLLDIADEVGVNVILLTGRAFLSNTDANAEDYEEYLAAIADDLQNEPALMAYDLDNEPGWGTSFTPFATYTINYRTTEKNKICSYVGGWYDAIKAEDAHHLVTMNNTDLSTDIMTYDPAIMKLDFNSLHFYEQPVDGTTDALQAVIDRLAIKMYWMHNNSPLPWIIGETGFKAMVASSNTTPWYCTVNSVPNVDVSLAPHMWGSFERQTAYATAIQQLTANYEGSGFSWWQFQDAAYPNPYQYCFLDMWGLLEPGDPDETSPGVFSYSGNDFEKPCVDDAFTANAVIAANAPAEEPVGYYNPFGGSNLTNYTVAGTIEDENNVPVKDAIIVGGNGTENHFVPPANAFEIYTFSQVNGTFELTAPIGHITDGDPIDPIDYSRFMYIHYSAPAASHEGFDCSGLPTLPDGGGNITTETFGNVIRSAGIFDNSVGILSSVTINSGNSPASYTSRHILTVEDVIVANTGVADLYASVEVDLKPGFEAVSGSETDVYITTVDMDCNPMATPTAYKTDETGSSYKEVPVTEKSIEVVYQLERVMRLIPNPANDIVFIETNQPTLCVVEITNAIGALVYTDIWAIDKKTELPVSDLTTGSYFVKISTAAHADVFKLMINR